jgi:hypothetical protein
MVSSFLEHVPDTDRADAGGPAGRQRDDDAAASRAPNGDGLPQARTVELTLQA